jgi:site-specific DNA-methyltransferase (adenine-specific)
MAECLRITKPGGHALIWALPRTSHWTGAAIENAGWEIRDCIDHIFYSGFPKSLDVSKAIDRELGSPQSKRGQGAAIDRVSLDYGGATGKSKNGLTASFGAREEAATAEAKRYQGWGAALKPAHECWWLARKPLIGTVAANVLEYGTGALNIDGCRFRYGDPCWPGPQEIGDPNRSQGCDGGSFVVLDKYPTIAGHTLGRWPANIYYSPKPSPSEREAGCVGLTQHSAGDLTGGRVEGSNGLQSPRAGAGRTSSGRGNTHPTVKSINLMRWLCRLITPPGGTVLDPFAGSGTTILACEAEGFACTAVELDPNHCDIIRARHAAATAQMRLAL